MDNEVMVEIKKLSDRVQYLEDQLVKQRRENANLMEELETSRTSGISSSFVGTVGKKFSEIMQTEDKIQMTVANVSDEAKKQYSKYEQTAQKIETQVADLSDEVDTVAGDISEVEQTASSISSTVTKIYGEVVISDTAPTDTGDFDKEKMYSCNGTFYYYNDVLKKWVAADSKSVFSQILQTKDGVFVLGNVKVSGTQIIGDDLYIGDNSASEPKMLRFNNTANISTIEGITPGSYTALKFSAERMQLGESTYIYFGKSCTVDFSNTTVTSLYAVFE